MRWFILIMVSYAMTTSAASGATWQVERDGSGDFSTIQPAVDSASPGDTIRIGPGRYTEHQLFSPSGVWSRETYVAITVDNLTFIGAERDSVVIGPDTADTYDFGPHGMVTSSLVTRVSVYSLTVTNVYAGLLSFADIRAEGSAFRGCDYGIIGWCNGNAAVTRCVFVQNKGDGIISDTPTTRLDVSECHFMDNARGLDAIATPQVAISNCDFQGGTVGLQFERGSQGAITDCRIHDVYSTGVWLTEGAVATMVNNVIDGGQANIICVNDASGNGTRNILRGASYVAILIGHANMTLSGSHVLFGGRRLVELQAFQEPPVVKIDLRNNYWGIADRDSIADLIWDGNDDPSIYAVVVFEPFSATPLPAEKKSLGGVKWLYR